MCALQMQAEAGPTLLDQSDGLEPYLEKYIVRQVSFGKVSLGTGFGLPACQVNLCSALHAQSMSSSLSRCSCNLL